MIDAGMLPPHTEYSPVLREAQHFPENQRAGHFEHVAHMNMFDSESPTFRIPAKISFVKLSDGEAESSGLGEKKINVSDSDLASRERDICSKLIKQVKLDVRLSDGEDHGGIESYATARSSEKERRKSRGRREENGNKPQVQKDVDEDRDWAGAKGKVEEFLDFPGVMSAMAIRNQSKVNGSSQSSPRNGGGLLSQGQANTIPNTRHNAIFLRDHEEAAEVILLNQKVKQPQSLDSHQSTTESQDHGTKMVEKPKSLVDGIVTEAHTGTRR
ncbi:uncharacterized protein LOC142750820 [Rhinoderma darwinii]|uniref:uncharacterized protein LOC142750820 n=1 Tax=Rhinoderma darwinii TaxID=43563 RepID=UPI003F67D1A5